MTTNRRVAADIINGVGRQALALRFDALAAQVRADWHEPDEQGVGAIVFGRRLDNAFGSYINPNEPESQSEIVIVLTKNGEPHCTRNLASVLAEAAAYRRAVQSRQLEPSNVHGPGL